MNGSESDQQRGAVSWTGVWRFVATMAVLLFAGMFAAHKSTVLETFYWIGSDVEIRQPDGTWASGRVLQIGKSDEIQELRVFIEISDDPWWQEPIGLNVAGPFSAELTWDGVLVGEKGKVGADRESEIPGTIDSITLIPAELLEPGRHELRMRISTQYAIDQAVRIIHILALAPYRVDDRRLLRYYAVPILLMSGLLILIVQSLRIGFSTGSRLYSGLGVFGLFILLSLASEVSRALVNYSYNFHGFRGFFMWASLVCAGLTLNFICFSLHKQPWVRYVLLAAIILGVVTGYVGLGGDRQIALNFLSLAAAPAAIHLWFFLKKEVTFLSTLPLFWLACVVSFAWSIGLFLDSYIFIASIIFLASAWFWVYVEKPEPEPAETQPGRLVVKSKGREIFVSPEDAVYLKAEGNFTTIMKADGSSLLHQLPLGKILLEPPPGFVRVHRSYAVNKAYIRALRSAPGSKYWLEMNGADDVPVSRYRVAEVRGILAA